MDNSMPAHRLADKEKAPYVMGYLTRADIPFQFALAEATQNAATFPPPVLPSADQIMPKQEKGSRKRVPAA